MSDLVLCWDIKNFNVVNPILSDNLENNATQADY